MLKFPIYLDHNSTTPCDAAVVEAMLPYFTGVYGNAASNSHLYGWQAAEAIDLAREQVASLIGADKTEIIFTSGATESINLAIKGVDETYGARGRHIITCGTEHKAVVDTVKHLERNGAMVTWLAVDQQGHIDLQELESAIRPETVLIALMYANNETGVIHPVAEIGRIAKKHEVLFFCDGAQAVGKIPVDVRQDGIDLLSISAHKFYGPKGVGALYVRRRDPRVRPTAQMDGGGHERGMRSGTLNVPGIVGMGKACEISAGIMHQEAARLAQLRDRLEQGLLAIPQTRVNGDPVNRLPHVSNLSFAGMESQVMMMGFSKNIAVSSGSACTSATMEPSYVLAAMGLADELAFASLRFGLGRGTTQEQIDFVIAEIRDAVAGTRKLL